MDRSAARRVSWWAALSALYLAHNDVWLWDAPHRLAWAGSLPAGLVYHAGYCVAAALAMAWAVHRFPWGRLDHPPIPRPLPHPGLGGDPRP